MLVVKLELWPGGDASRKREIGRTYINNVGGSDKKGNYNVRVMKKGQEDTPTHEVFRNQTGIVRVGSVANYPRLSYNVWRLIIRALKSAFPEES